MSDDLIELLKVQSAAITQAYRTALDIGYERGRMDANKDLLVALKELLKNVEEFPFESISIEHPLMTGVPLARAAIAKADGK